MNTRARSRGQHQSPTSRNRSIGESVGGIALAALGAAGLMALPLASPLSAAPGKATPGKATPAKATPAKAKPAAQKSANAAPSVQTEASAKIAPRPMPRYLSMESINTLRALRGEPRPALQPYYDGQSFKGKDLSNILTIGVGAAATDGVGGRLAQAFPPVFPQAAPAVEALPENRALAQVFPPPVVTPPPAVVAPAAVRTAVPRWVRYPLEFQLAGIALGSRAVDKDAQNRIDRYGLFAIHGNPTAVVVPTIGAGGGVAITQQPPEISDLFPAQEDGGLPAWALAITVDLDENHVQWLYRRETYSMGFVVDRLGFVDAIVVAGVESPITRTQLEDPIHTVKLGDDLRKVLFRYGYPDTIDTYLVNALAGSGVGAATAGGGEGGSSSGYGGEGAAGGSGATGGDPRRGGGGSGATGGTSGTYSPSGSPSGEGGEAGAAGAGAAGNSAFRTFEVRYEQSYNVVFTIRNNRVVRIYIFGDPDFFTEARRQEIRTRY